MRARLVVASVLLGLQGMVLALGTGNGLTSLLLCALHVVAVLAVQHLFRPQLRHGLTTGPWAFTVGVDVLVFAGLQVMQHGGLNYTLLFALPVLMSAILGPQRRGLATAALVTLFLLGEAIWALWDTSGETAPRLFQTAITGTSFFLVALLAHQLAVRLAREEALSERSQLAARTQVAVNELVIDTMSDGVLVVDERGLVRTANPAARQMLGDDQGDTPHLFLLDSRPYCLPLLDLVRATFDTTASQHSEVLLEATPDLRRRLRVRTRLTATHGSDDSIGAADLCVVFLEDLYELEARVRTEKLAGMGRMSVAVAHEIRNPLSAIAQANALLLEDLHDPQQLRLAQMVANHTQRLNRIVDDVLNVVRVPGQLATTDAPVIALDASVSATLQEWSTQHTCVHRVQWLAGAGQAHIRFDPEHLRRVLVNLLDNASRYASQATGAIQISTRAEADGVLRLSVWSDGAPLDHSVRRHLFEPFFSSESRSSGMGLYLCRELCDRYEAKLDYQRTERQGTSGNEFFLLIPSAMADFTP
jgi:two-component system sensor histidine kinase PilS (NtrC family)